jgi:hypothetical protein
LRLPRNLPRRRRALPGTRRPPRRSGTALPPGLTRSPANCQLSSHSQADFVSCLKAHGVQVGAASNGQAKLGACLQQAHDATALGRCAKLVGAP